MRINSLAVFTVTLLCASFSGAQAVEPLPWTNGKLTVPLQPMRRQLVWVE